MSRFSSDRLQLADGGGPAGAEGRIRTVRVLEEDPELGDGLSPAQMAAATDAAHAAVMTLAPGEWPQGSWPASISTGLGLLMFEGLLLRSVRLGDRFGVELLARGDLLRPWQRDDDIALIPRQARWQVLEASRLAVLDVEFAHRVSRFPQIAGQVAGRAMRRSRSFAVNMAIVQQPRVEARVRMLLWHLADRWGIVRPDGVFVPLRLTQTVVAELVAARRPTVSAAIGVLERDGQLTRTDGGWLLHGSPPGEPSRA